LNLKGDPYTLKDHFPFAPLIRVKMAQTMTLMCGRQVSKSTSGAAQGLVFSSCVPQVTTLYITPLFEQVRKFSANYVKPFIVESPMRTLMMDTTTGNSVLQREFRNRSKMLFSFANDNADRVRGISCDLIKIDEVQDTDMDILRIIFETSTYSKWNVQWMSGTPKTLDNTLTKFWNHSSRAEWFIRCREAGCNEWNIPSGEYHLLDMIGPMRNDISINQPALVCHKCRKPLDPRTGRWVHREANKRWINAGYHLPQTMLPHHYANPTNWSKILVKQQNMMPSQFYNEVLGEPFDSGSKIITETDLRAAATLPWKNTWRFADQSPGPDGEKMLETAGGCAFRVLGVDWGGGGKLGVSYTTLSLVGWTPDGMTRILWGKRLLTPHEPDREADEVLRWFRKLSPHMLVHDYTGAGFQREHILVQAGLPIERDMPIAYVTSCGRKPIRPIPCSDVNPRPYWQMGKSRALQMVCTAIRMGGMTSFQWDRESDEVPGLLGDFLSLIDEKNDSSVGGYYVIKAAANMCDDFAQATTMATMACWHVNDAWPNFVKMGDIEPLAPNQIASARGHDELGWSVDDANDSFFPASW